MVDRKRCARSPVVKEIQASGPDAAELLVELRGAGALEHPNIARILDVVETADGVTVVLQAGPGGSLADLLAARGSLEPGEAVAVIAPVADALAAAHGAGIVHGDVSPANVVLDDDGTPLLIDFDRRSGGTPGYTAPDAHASEAGDVYALASTCIDALGGDVPSGLVPVLDAATAPDADVRPSSSELARLLREAVPEDSIRLPGPAPSHVRAITPRTRQFGPRPPAVATTARVHVRWRWFAAASIVIAVGVGAWALRSTDSRATTPQCEGDALPVPPNAQVVRGDTTGAGCLSTGIYVDQVLTVRVRRDVTVPQRYALGLPGDVLHLGDWNCDGIDSPALERPSTGQVLYYDTWTTHESPSPAPSCAFSTQ